MDICIVFWIRQYCTYARELEEMNLLVKLCRHHCTSALIWGRHHITFSKWRIILQLILWEFTLRLKYFILNSEVTYRCTCERASWWKRMTFSLAPFHGNQSEDLEKPIILQKIAYFEDDERWKIWTEWMNYLILKEYLILDQYYFVTIYIVEREREKHGSCILKSNNFFSLW